MPQQKKENHLNKSYDGLAIPHVIISEDIEMIRKKHRSFSCSPIPSSHSTNPLSSLSSSLSPSHQSLERSPTLYVIKLLSRSSSSFLNLDDNSPISISPLSTPVSTPLPRRASTPRTPTLSSSPSLSSSTILSSSPILSSCSPSTPTISFSTPTLSSSPTIASSLRMSCTPILSSSPTLSSLSLSQKLQQEQQQQQQQQQEQQQATYYFTVIYKRRLLSFKKKKANVPFVEQLNAKKERVSLNATLPWPIKPGCYIEIDMGSSMDSFGTSNLCNGKCRPIVHSFAQHSVILDSTVAQASHHPYRAYYDPSRPTVIRLHPI